MGKVLEKVIIKNFIDVIQCFEGIIKEENIRKVELEAIVDTGAALLCLPPESIKKIGLVYSRTRKIITANSEVERRIFSGAVIIIREREIQMEIMKNDQTTPPLIGYLVLENMDFVVDSKSQMLIPNPAHDGKWITDLL